MKFAQDLRAGNVVVINGQPWVIHKAEYNKSGRQAAVVKVKMSNVLTAANTETVYKADEKFEDLVLDRKAVKFSYFGDPLYVFMDEEFNQYEIGADSMGDALNYLEDDMPCEVVFYNGKAISVELPTKLIRKVMKTEPAVRGDTSGKVMKPAQISTGFVVSVPAFISEEDSIEIDTRTGEYCGRVQK